MLFLYLVFFTGDCRIVFNQIQKNAQVPELLLKTESIKNS